MICSMYFYWVMNVQIPYQQKHLIKVLWINIRNYLQHEPYCHTLRPDRLAPSLPRIHLLNLHHWLGWIMPFSEWVVFSKDWDGSPNENGFCHYVKKWKPVWGNSLWSSWGWRTAHHCQKTSEIRAWNKMKIIGSEHLNLIKGKHGPRINSSYVKR